MLLLASPVTQSLAVGGTLSFGTGCGDSLTHGDCEQWRSQCLELCAAEDFFCMATCEENYDVCWVDAEDAAERRREAAAAAGEVALACAAILVCTLESLEDEEQDTERDSGIPEPASEDGDGVEDEALQCEADEDWAELAVPVDLPE